MQHLEATPPLDDVLICTTTVHREERTMGMSPSPEPGGGFAPRSSAAPSTSAEPAYMCTRRLALRVEFQVPSQPVQGWEEAQRATCMALGQLVLAEAERQGLALTLWADWEWKSDPSGPHWLVQWQTAQPVPVRDTTVDLFARSVQDEFLTPAVGRDHVTRALAMALPGTSSISG